MSQYSNKENDLLTLNEDMATYPQGVIIPVNLPSTGKYSVEDFKKKLTDFGMRLLHQQKPSQTVSHINWRDITISDKIKSMTLGSSCLSSDTRSDEELLIEALEEKYR